MSIVAAVFSFCLVALSSYLSLAPLSQLTAVVGYSLFWSVTIRNCSGRRRFFLGTVWFFGVQLLHLSWLTSHPYLYIYLFWSIISLYLAVQFGLLTFLVTEKRISSFMGLLSLASLWVLMEWSRFFIFCGFTFGAVGEALATHLVTLQLGAIGGVFLLSFWVVLTNLLSLKLLLNRAACWRWNVIWVIVALFPYLFGAFHLSYQKKYGKLKGELNVILVQTGTVPEETLPFTQLEQYLQFCHKEWEKGLELIASNALKGVDLIVFPEGFVPFSTDQLLYPLEDVERSFAKVFGKEVAHQIPSPTLKNSRSFHRRGKVQTFVSHAYWGEALADLLNCSVIVGLNVPAGGKRSYNGAVQFDPQKKSWKVYGKRVLLPMGEYIPFEWAKEIAKGYGIEDSFARGESVGVFKLNDQVKLGLSVCYEETFGEVMRENKGEGADLLVNITNDGWYPRSTLPYQHFVMARQRSVELGLPLLRSCSTGVTCAIDSSGRVIAKLDERDGAASLAVQLPVMTYSTLYSKFGDSPVLLLSLLFSFQLIDFRRSA